MQFFQLGALSLFFIISSAVSAESKLNFPKNILKLDSRFTHHVFLVEKSTHQLHIYENNEGRPKHVKTYKIATGKAIGDKRFQGDHKTPEGVYLLTSFLSEKDLLDRYQEQAKIYGPGAFTLNYPNIIDRREGKTGGGIWLHSTDDNTRVDKGLDSRGCVVVVDTDLKNVSQYIDLKNTDIIVVQDIHLLKPDTWENNRNDILGEIRNWQLAWEAENLNDYISHYHPTLFTKTTGKDYNEFKRYKRAVFSHPGTPKISIKSISVLLAEDYAVAHMEQHYESSILPYEVGKKTLYFQKDENYRWRIIHEAWQKLPSPADVAFKPSQNRYFSDANAESESSGNI
jgi:murein L,D-transpeptidase YafK